MTEHYFEPEMDVVEFPDVDVITTSSPVGEGQASISEITLGTGPSDTFLE